MRRPSIRLLLSSGVFCQHITDREAEELAKKGYAVRVTPPSKKRKKKGRIPLPGVITYRLLPEPPILRSMDEASPPSITTADMLANVGITPGLGDTDRGRMYRARKKIRLFEPLRRKPEPPAEEPK